MPKKPMLNLGCGRIILPCEKPEHHQLVVDEIYDYPEWVNIDRNDSPGVDCVMDLFRYPWGLEDNAYSGALISHVCEHIPHNIKPVLITNAQSQEYKKWCELEKMQDGWFAFFSELWRVLEDGAMVHIISPYAWSDDGVNDPTHTRMLTEFSFRHSMVPDPNAPFDYNRKLHFDVLEETPMRPTPLFMDEPYFVDGKATRAFWRAKETQINVVRDFYVRMRAVKGDNHEGTKDTKIE